MRNAYRVVAGNRQGKRLLRKHKLGCKDNLKWITTT